MKKIALLGGAFNPIHKGHIQLSQYVLDNSSFDEVWLMPTYNHMYNKDLVDSNYRLKMCEILSNVDKRIKVFDYEIINKLSGSTYKLLEKLLKDKNYMDYQFSLIIGIDNANTFNKWFNYKQLQKMISFVVVPRKGYDKDKNVNWFMNKPHIYLNEHTNIIEISSTEVRELLKNNSNDVFKYIDEEVIDYIKKNKLYENLV